MFEFVGGMSYDWLMVVANYSQFGDLMDAESSGEDML